jgi:hypothetical protein
MANINYEVEAPGKRKELLSGAALTTTSGTLSTAAGANTCEGFTVAKIAGTGRYQATLQKGYNSITFAAGSVEISASTAAVTAKGVVVALRGVSASGKVATFQVLTPPLAAGAGVDVEVEDGATLRFLLVARRGTM